MTSEVQLIAWKQAMTSDILYTGNTITAQATLEHMKVQIAPIAGLVATDLEGYWIELTNPSGQSQWFPIMIAIDNTSVWRLLVYQQFADMYLSEYDFTIASYQIGTREYTGNLEGDLTTVTQLANNRLVINGDVSYLLGKTIQANIENGEKFCAVVIEANYIVIDNQTRIDLIPETPPTGYSGKWSIIYDTAPYYIELYPNESISQNWRFTDISNFGTTGAFSREFRIPASYNNTQIFGLVEEINFNDTLNYFHTKLKAEIRVSTFPIASGHLRLQKTYTQNGKYSDLELSFYAETPDLTREIGQQKLKDLTKLNTLNHFLTYAAVTNDVFIIATGAVAFGGGIGDSFVQIPEQINLQLYIGKQLILSNGVDTAIRTITAVDDLPSLTKDELQWTIALTEDYSSGTWEIRDLSISDNVKYALCDRGQRWDETGATLSRPISDSTNPLYAGDMTPHLNGWFLFNQILSDAGFSLNPTPLESILSSYWIPWINSPSIQVSNQDSQYLFRAQLDTTALFDYGDIMTFPTIYDNGSLFSGSAYQLPFPAYYTFRVWLTFTPVDLYGGQQSISFQLRKGSDVIYTQSVFISSADIAAGTPVNVQFTTNPIFLNPNIGSNSVNLITNTFYSNTPFYGATSYDPNNASGWELVSITNPAYGALYQINSNAPDIKQIDYVKDILNMHCCAVVPDKVKPNVISIIPMVDYVNSGNTLDWTDKLDISKDMVLLPTTDKQNKTLLFTYKNGGDVASKFFTDNGRTYGEYEIDGYTVNANDVSNDFADGELKIQLTAESNPSNYIKGTSLVISKYINDKGEFVNPNLRFVYMAGNALVKLYDEVNDVVQNANILTTSHYSDTYADVADYDLNFAPETPLHVIESNPFFNLFNLYWRSYLNEIYSPKARILEAYFALDAIDIQSFSFADKIWIKDSYWRILEISDYKVGLKESTKLILLKTDIEEPDCQSVPSGDVNGQITFVDFDGNPVDASPICCVRYGYEWDEQLGWCVDRGESTNSPSDPTPLGLATNNVMQGQTLQPTRSLSMVTGSNISVDNNWSTFVGRDITTPNGNEFSTMQGDYITHQPNQPASAIFGSNVLVPIKGLHFGGGWRGDRLSTAQGSQQCGFITLMNGHKFNFNNDQIEIIVGNESIDRLNLANDTQWSCILTMHMSDNGGFWAYSMYTFTIYKTASTSYASAPIQIVIDDAIGNQFDLNPVIDVATNPAEHRFYARLTDIGGIPYTFPTPQMNIVATLQYTQSR